MHWFLLTFEMFILSLKRTVRFVVFSNPYGKGYRKRDGRFDKRQGRGGGGGGGGGGSGRGGGGGGFRGDRGGGGLRARSGWFKVTVSVITFEPVHQQIHIVIHQRRLDFALSVWQIPHGRKYEKKWLVTALQNICSVPYTPVQVSLSTVS